MVKKQEFRRLNGRTQGQLRSMESEQSLLNKADGSAKFSQNKTSVLAAVYGPIEVNSARKEKILKSYVEVTFTPALGNTTYLDKEKELLVKNAVESVILTTLHPRTQVSVIIQVYSDDGSIVSCSINAACLALLDAGIEMNGLIGSITLMNEDDDEDNNKCLMIVDPDLNEENNSKAMAIFAFSSNSNNIVMSKTIGTLTEDQYFECLKAARGCDSIIAYMKLAVKNRIMGQNN
ncbi:hypothetical protein DICPUDRAFT_85962 [Dictyostelium purpureum]|uniref:Uncharacterized protein n=1 Tax=Dictyostelium purpureum TaxID=5786 RepID=F0Z8I4_DICPU|nr:uncharacterized protein DICPUDRAFT_85962 [Dictyostelium purpureum]EGC39763.1 hypothetical protein DICPUDRAFT_85962 [Dictyostelium purpureum]|eukprot:XP_003283749.1 hypothetical protein DICPUDRAFT_85962 [Dictyostelium purpureum]